MKTVIWEVFEVIVNIYQGIMMLYFPFKYLGGKFSNKFTRNYGLIFSCILTLIITLFNHITDFEHIYIIFYFALIFIYSCLCLNQNIYYKIFASVYPVVVVTLCSASVIGVSSIIFGKSFEDILVNNDLQRFIVILAVQLLIFYTTFASLKLLRISNPNNTQLSATEISLITAILVANSFFLSLIFFNNAFSHTQIILV